VQKSGGVLAGASTGGAAPVDASPAPDTDSPLLKRAAVKRGEDRDVVRVGAVLARFRLTPIAALYERQRYRGDRAGGRLRVLELVHLSSEIGGAAGARLG
jgi:hypothetical protein